MLPTRKLLFECPRSTGARARVRGETRRASRVLPLFGRPKIAAHSSVSLPRVYDAQRKCGAKVLFLYLFFCSFYHFPDWDRCVYGAKASSGFLWSTRTVSSISDGGFHPASLPTFPVYFTCISQPFVVPHQFRTTLPTERRFRTINRFILVFLSLFRLHTLSVILSSRRFRRRNLSES